MTVPLRVYLHEDGVLPSTLLHTCTTVATAPWSNAQDHRPGRLFELGAGFILRDDASDYIRIANSDTGDSVGFTLTDDGYTGASLGTYLTTAIAAEFAANPGYVDPVVVVTYDNSTRKFAFASTANTIIYWTYSARTMGLALVMGWDGTADTSAGTSHVSDNATFVQDRQWAAWDIGATGSTPEAFMVYATNLTAAAGTTDRLYLYGHTTDLGSNPDDWEAAEYTSGQVLATRSELNDLVIFDTSPPSGTIYSGALRYWCLQWTRNEAQASMDNARFGVIEAWDDANFDGRDYTPEVNFLTPWRRIPVTGSVASFPAAGGGLNIADTRGHVEVLLPFEDWDAATYRALEGLYDRKGALPALWVPDMDDPLGGGYAPDGVFAVISRWDGAVIDGVEDYRTFSIGLRAVPMPPVGSL